MKVSIISVNWNGAAILRKFIENLLSIEYENLEIIIVDNGSTDNSVEIISGYSKIILIKLPVNTGFAGGNNEGIQISSGDFVLLINTDVLCRPDVITKLLNEYNHMIQNNPALKIGALMPVIKLENGKINSLGSYLYADFQPFNLGFNEDESRINDLISSRITTGFYGACVMLNRKMIDETGLMNEEYFLYHEETELAIRGAISGWEYILVRDCSVDHFHSYSSKELSFKKIFFSERNRLFNLIKFGGIKQILISPLYTFKRFILSLKNKKLIHSSSEKKGNKYLNLAGVIFAIAAAHISLLFFLDILVSYKLKNWSSDFKIKTYEVL